MMNVAPRPAPARGFFRPLGEVAPHAAAVKCPSYWECGDYALMARPGLKPGRIQVACPYHARQIEDREILAEQNGSGS